MEDIMEMFFIDDDEKTLKELAGDPKRTEKLWSDFYSDFIGNDYELKELFIKTPARMLAIRERYSRLLRKKDG